MKPDNDILAAHRFCVNNRELLMQSDKCGCFSCLRIFSPTEIVNWTDDDKTAICPFCSVDAIIGDKTDYPLTKVFLQKMYEYWFS